MSVESMPSFTDPAAKLWATVPADTKKLLSKVWSDFAPKPHAHDPVTMPGVDTPPASAQSPRWASMLCLANVQKLRVA
jgi:hypothetical protein